MIHRIFTSLLGVIMAVAIISTATMSNALAKAPGYWADDAGEILRNGAGQCYRTQFWEIKYAIAECESADIVDTDKDGVVNSKDTCPNSKPDLEINAQGCELDSDNDGLANSIDSCPDTMAGVEVDASGCGIPIAEIVVVVMDGDNDGVVDASDDCPTTVTGAQVDSKGCELDSDGDGIADSGDQCFNTISGNKVDAKGCKLIETFALKGVVFKSGSDSLKEDSTEMLNKVAEALKRHPDMIVEIGGYTDNRGSERLNKALSEKRAASVASYLTSRGVSAASLQAKGYGVDSPIADNNTVAGRAQNRRVELRVIQQPSAQEFQFALEP